MTLVPTTRPLPGIAIFARLAATDLAAAQGATIAIFGSMPWARPAGPQIATALTNADVSRTLRIPRHDRQFRDLFRTR